MRAVFALILFLLVSRSSANYLNFCRMEMPVSSLVNLSIHTKLLIGDKLWKMSNTPSRSFLVVAIPVSRQNSYSIKDLAIYS